MGPSSGLAAQGGCGVLILGDAQNPMGKDEAEVLSRTMTRADGTASARAGLSWQKTIPFLCWCVFLLVWLAGCGFTSAVM